MSLKKNHKINYLRNRFSSMLHTYIGDNLSFLAKCFYLFDYFFALLFQGASVSDYFAYGFFKKRRNGRNEYITYTRFHKIQNKCNNKIDIDICRDKRKFNNYFSGFLGRTSLDVSTSTIEEFKSFFENYSDVFVKDALSYRGVGVKAFSISNTDVEQLYHELKSDKNCQYILEEKIVQAESLAEFHPWSINTIRVVTLYDNKRDEVHIMNARLRLGNNKNRVDNFHYNGIGANIHIESGIVNSVGYDVHNNTYLTHPITGKQIIGFKIPFWEECKEFSKKAARHIPTVRYIGWDIVLLESGSFILIEGNDNADHDFQQIQNKGLWREYKKILSQIS